MLGLLDFILNLAGLLLWLNWRASGFDPLARATPATLAGTLRRAGKTSLKRWHFPAMIGGLLLLRALFYWQIGSAVGWAAGLDLGAISVVFRSDLFGRILLFSLLSFALTLGTFYVWLILLSLLKRDTAEADPFHKLVRLHLGALDRLPRWTRALLPLVAGACIWWLLSWPLAKWGIIPHPVSAAHRVEQAVVIGLCAYLPWKFLLAALLVLHLANTYIYFGNHPFWGYINSTANTLLQPLRFLPLQLGKVDFAPVLGIVLIFLVSQLAAGEVTIHVFKRIRIMGIPDLYQALPF